MPIYYYSVNISLYAVECIGTYMSNEYLPTANNEILSPQYIVWET